MGTENLAKKIDLVVITGSIPFITAGVFQEDDTDATLISGALSGMSNMFQELLQQGELRHSELYNAHIYIRHLTQMNDSLGLISPEIKHGAQMRVAIIVREGELTREQELALSELCYSIMVKICEKPNLAKKLIKGNVEGYLPSSKETIEILSEAISDYRKRAKKSLFYENTNFLQEKDRFTILPLNDSLLEQQIQDFSLWIEENNYPDFFPKIDFAHFFGKQVYWESVNKNRKLFTNDLKSDKLKEQVFSSIFNYVLQAGLMPLVLYSENIIKRIEIFLEKELPFVFNEFINNLMIIRGPIGISLRAINANLSKLRMDEEKKVGWNFIKFFLLEIGNRPFEQPYLKQLCKLVEQFEIKEEFLSAIQHSNSKVVPQEYTSTFVSLVNRNFAKPIEINDLTLATKKEVNNKLSKAKTAPSIPKSTIPESSKKKTVSKSKSTKEPEISLPKVSPESTLIKNQAIIKATSAIYSWAHDHIFGKISLKKKNLPTLSNDGLFFYNISESLTIEMGLIFDLIQAFSSPRTWLIGQVSRIIDVVEDKLRVFDPDLLPKYSAEKKLSIDVEHVNEQFRIKSERIISIITQIETNAVKGRITKENKKSVLESGFLGRVHDFSIPQTRKLLAELKSMNKNLASKELDMISKATSVNFKGLTTNVTSLQLLAIPLPEKESEYTKETREVLNRFRKWDFALESTIQILFQVCIEIADPLQPNLHETILRQFLRTCLPDPINNKLESYPNSDLERKEIVASSFILVDDLFTTVGSRLMHNIPLKLFTTIPLSKVKDEKNFLFSFSPLKPPTISEEILRFFIVTKHDQEEIIGRIYTYKTFNEEEISNLTELIISDAFRRAYSSVEPGLTKIIRIAKRIHSGVPNLQNLLLNTYQLICNQLSIKKTTI